MPTESLHVHYLPQFVGESDLAGATVVVIDLLRASTTICHALAAGVKEVSPFLEVGDVVRAAEGQNRSELILGGERKGLLIEGFDLGNSPQDYTPERVFGKRMLFTTTNGARALEHARLAERIVVGAMANLSALVEAIAGASDVHLLCAGTDGHVTREDLLAAGAIAAELLTRGERELTEPAASVRGEWEELVNAGKVAGRTPSEQLAQELRTIPHGQRLVEIGYEDDLRFCALRDSANVLPDYDPRTRKIVAA